MVRLKELPDNLDESISLDNGAPAMSSNIATPHKPATASPSSTSPVPSAALPPAMEFTKQHTTDELIEMINRVPLFMTELDETDGGEGNNVDLDALKALAYEGTRVEIAGGFKERGNECARDKQWADAREFYGQALAALKAEEEEPEMNIAEEKRDVEADKRKEMEIEEACYVNRALCNLELSRSIFLPLTSSALDRPPS